MWHKSLITLGKTLDKKLPAQTILAIICLAILLNACSPARVTPVPTLPPVPTVIPTQPSSTRLPSVTPTLAKTATPTPTITPTFTPTPMTDFSKAKVIAAGALPNWQCLIDIQVPEKIIGEYYAIVEKNKTYTCIILPNQPNRLYCSGPLAGIDKIVNLQVFQKGLDYPVFEAAVRMPPLQ
jgi:hypothetical protein